MSIWAAVVFRLVLPAVVPAAEAFVSTNRPAPRGWVWTATRGDAEIVLVGTVHAGPVGDDRLPLEVARRWPDTTRLAVEVDMGDASRIAAAVASLGVYPPDSVGLDGRLDLELRRRVERVVGKAAPAPWRMKPWMLANTIVVAHMARWGLAPAFGVEALLLARARADGKAVVEIETVETQLRVFDGAPEAIQLAYLDETVRALDTGQARHDIDRILAAHFAGDADALEQLYEDFASRPGRAERHFHRHLIVGRNAGMIEAIDRLARDGGRTMVAVGALHYPGPEGILAGLRGRGYEVRPVGASAPAGAGASR